MADNIQPVPEQWYLDVDEEVLFEILSVENDIIQIQYHDGEAEEINMEAWKELELELIENPQSWISNYEDMDSDDFINGEDDADWNAAYEER